MHVIFVCCLYAWEDSWTYYAFLLVMAAAAVIVRAPVLAGRALAAALGLLLAMTLFVQFIEWTWAWGRHRGPDTGDLWAYDTMVDDFSSARQATAGKKTLWLANGDLQAMFPELESPQCWFMGKAFLLDDEMTRGKAG